MLLMPLSFHPVILHNGIFFVESFSFISFSYSIRNLFLGEFMRLTQNLFLNTGQILLNFTKEKFNCTILLKSSYFLFKWIFQNLSPGVKSCLTHQN